MQGESYIGFNAEAYEAFRALPEDHQVDMVNLLRFRQCAAYPPKYPAAGEALAGEQAYARYAGAGQPKPSFKRESPL